MVSLKNLKNVVVLSHFTNLQAKIMAQTRKSSISHMVECNTELLEMVHAAAIEEDTAIVSPDDITTQTNKKYKDWFILCVLSIQTRGYQLYQCWH